MAISNCNNCEYHAAETCSLNPDYAQAFQSLGNLPDQAQAWVGARLESCPHWQLSYDEELLTAPVQLPRRIWRILAAQTNGLTPLALVAQDLLSGRMVAEVAEAAEAAEVAEAAKAAEVAEVAEVAEAAEAAEPVTTAGAALGDELDSSAIAPSNIAETVAAKDLELSGDLEDPEALATLDPAGDLDPAENLTAAEAPDLNNGSGFSAASTSEPQTFEGTPVTVGQQMSEADLEVAIASFLHGIAGGEAMTALEETRADISRGSGRVSNQQAAPTVSLPAFRHWPGL